MTKKRIDVSLVEKKLAESREKAQSLIEQGRVLVNGIPVKKTASLVDEFSKISVVEDKGVSFVSRGGLKLEKALDAFGVDPTGLNVIDIGASTGGFTDCVLRRGARAVTAVDVGYGQLAWSLRNDPRVTVMERTNIRNVSPEDFDALFDLAVIDVSFISLDKILDAVVKLLVDCNSSLGTAVQDGAAESVSDRHKSRLEMVVGGPVDSGRANKPGAIISLIKPQFEAGRERVGKKGVVREASVHRDILGEVWDAFERRGLIVRGLSYSPIKGPEGNIEFLIYATTGNRVDADTPSELSSCPPPDLATKLPLDTLSKPVSKPAPKPPLDTSRGSSNEPSNEPYADGREPMDKITLIKTVVDDAHRSL